MLPGKLSIFSMSLTFSNWSLLGSSNSSTGLEVSFVSLLCYVDINSYVLPSSSSVVRCSSIPLLVLPWHQVSCILNEIIGAWSVELLYINKRIGEQSLGRCSSSSCPHNVCFPPLTWHQAWANVLESGSRLPNACLMGKQSHYVCLLFLRHGGKPLRFLKCCVTNCTYIVDLRSCYSDIYHPRRQEHTM